MQNISITLGMSWGKAETMSLAVPKGDVSATSGVTLGGAEIKTDGGWEGSWTPMAIFSNNGKLDGKSSSCHRPRNQADTKREGLT